MNNKEAFKKLYQEARTFVGYNNDWKYEPTAYIVTERAVDSLVQAGCDYRPLLEVHNAVLWAIHWTHFEPINTEFPLGMSEKHLCFSMGPDHCETWYERRLP